MYKIYFLFLIAVLVRDSGAPSLSSTVTVICKVLDENDHSPMFLLPTSEIRIPENQQPSIVYITRAVDMDAGDNGALRYKIISKLHSIFISTDEYPGLRLALILPGLSSSCLVHMLLSCRKKKSFIPLSALISTFQAYFQSGF